MTCKLSAIATAMLAGLALCSRTGSQYPKDATDVLAEQGLQNLQKYLTSHPAEGNCSFKTAAKRYEWSAIFFFFFYFLLLKCSLFSTSMLMISVGATCLLTSGEIILTQFCACRLCHPYLIQMLCRGPEAGSMTLLLCIYRCPDQYMQRYVDELVMHMEPG